MSISRQIIVLDRPTGLDPDWGVYAMRLADIFEGPVRMIGDAALSGNVHGTLIAPMPTSPQNFAMLVQTPARATMDMVVCRGCVRRGTRRLVVASGGGLHALKAIAVAGLLGRSWDMPVRVIRVVRPLSHMEPHRHEWEQYLEDIRNAMSLQCRMQNVNVDIDVVVGDAIGESVAERLNPDDMLLMGGPPEWRLPEYHGDSIPFRLLESVSNPVMLVIPAHTPWVSLGDVFWEDTICLKCRPAGARGMIDRLASALADEHQIPSGLLGDILRAARIREAIQSTAVGCETAMPHAALPGFPGVVGCMGICPSGAGYHGPDGAPVRFVFLLVAARDDYEPYLGVLAQLARVMHRESARAELLSCATPTAAATIIARESARTEIP